MPLFEEYKNYPDPFVRERANNWAIAIGLQHIDRLNVSDFLVQVARQKVEGNNPFSLFADINFVQ